MIESSPEESAQRYDAWFATPIGQAIDSAEAAAIFDLAKPTRGERALDAGCGTGNYTVRLVDAKLAVTALDIDSAMLDVARAKSPEAVFVTGDVEKLPFSDGEFDLTVCVTVLCFVRDPHAAVRELARVTRPGGRIVLGELNRWSFWAAERRLKGYFGSVAWRRARFFTAHALETLLREAGLDPVDHRSAAYLPPHSPSWLIDRNEVVERAGARFGPCGAAFSVASGAKPS